MMELYAAKGPRLFLDETSVFDIGKLIFRDVDLSPGPAVPDDGDARISHSVQGFLFTCGPDHIRHPEPIIGGADQASAQKYPLHGSFSASPAQVSEFHNGALSSHACATVMTRLADGGLVRLERRWHIDGVSGAVSLSDRVFNAGDRPFSPMLMYHMNIGAWNFSDETMISGSMLGESPQSWRFGPGDGHVFCVPADGGADGSATLSLGPIAAINGLTLQVSFETATLPFLQMWRNEALPANVVGIEPASHDWKPRVLLEEAGALTMLEPGGHCDYALRFIFV
jgi:hypothetical protein